MLICFEKGDKTKITANFRRNEFECHCGKQHECYIDEDLVQLLQELRDKKGRPVKNNSGYRCKDWNTHIGGDPNSNHMKGLAADIVIDGIDPRLVASTAARIGLRVGFYDTFTHVDVADGNDFIGKK